MRLKDRQVALRVEARADSVDRGYDSEHGNAAGSNRGGARTNSRGLRLPCGYIDFCCGGANIVKTMIIILIFQFRRGCGRTHYTQYRSAPGLRGGKGRGLRSETGLTAQPLENGMTGREKGRNEKV